MWSGQNFGEISVPERPLFMNRGAELLRAVGLPVRQIGERLGVKSPSQVHRWLQGTELPTTKRRVQIEAAWSVPVGAWEEPPATTPAAAPSGAANVSRPAGPPSPAAAVTSPPMAPPRPALVPLPVVELAEPPPSAGTVLDEARAQVERLRRMQRDAATQDVSLSVRVAIERELRNALAQLAEMTGALTPSDEERILGSEAWGRVQGAITDAARALPERCTRVEVCQALARALENLERSPSAAA